MNTDRSILTERPGDQPAVVPCPPWAKAEIVAELEEDTSDPMSDYFGSRTVKTVHLGWSRHNRDLFPELRKAAATFQETAHLGPGRDIWTARVVLTNDVTNANDCAFWKGSYSPWHDAPTFETELEARAFAEAAPKPHDLHMQSGMVATFAWEITKQSVEHREKYSMGHGYYLAGRGGKYSGWQVRKVRVGR